MKVLHLLLGASLLGALACGGGGGGTTPPVTGPTQTLSTIRLGTTTANLTAGNTTSLSPSALDSKGAVIAGVAGYTYATSNAAIAEASATGVVLATGAGTATITVSLSRDGVTATATSTVTVTGSLPTAASVAAGASDNTFTPATLVVARNANVTFSFGARQHNVTFRGTPGSPTNVANSTNASVALSFPTAGDFSYDCSLHAGMTGAVIVR
jgi:plastocyanin